jgi:hypothetical protein
VEWHENSTCEQYQDWRKLNAPESNGDAAFKRFLRNNKYRVHKRGQGGCGHACFRTNCNVVFCGVCKFHFCWFCYTRLPAAGDSNPHRHFDRPGPCYAKCFGDPDWSDEEEAAEAGDDNGA